MQLLEISGDVVITGASQHHKDLCLLYERFDGDVWFGSYNPVKQQNF